MGTLQRKSQTGTLKEHAEPKSMFRIPLGKTTTEFFSVRGNHRLKRIWLDNDLDEEMIFSSWIGPSEALVRQKVSDYMQAFLHRRSSYVPFRESDMFSLLRRFSVHGEFTMSTAKKDQDRLKYYNELVKATLSKRCHEREMAENQRIIKSVANTDLPAMPGSEHVLKHPIFRVEQLEKRMKYLSTIPVPYNQQEFEKHILPIMTSDAIATEKNCTSASFKCVTKSKQRTLLESPPKDIINDSGIALDDSFLPGDVPSDSQGSDSDLIQQFSDTENHYSDLKNVLDDTLGDVCEVCGGLSDSHYSDGLSCGCISDAIWDGKNSRTSSTLYTDASKIVNRHAKQFAFSQKYTKEASARARIKSKS